MVQMEAAFMFGIDLSAWEIGMFRRREYTIFSEAHTIPVLGFSIILAFFICVSALAADCIDVSNSFSGTVSERIVTAICSGDASCIESDPNGGACNAFAGYVLDRAYGISDFKTIGGYLVSAEIYNYVSDNTNHPAWIFLGAANSQSVLVQAQNEANSGIPVIALTTAHVAVVIPSIYMYSSSSWKLCVPISAAHFLNDPAENYDSGPLSKSWSSPEGVKLFERIAP
jgi:hypothetical protein